MSSHPPRTELARKATRSIFLTRLFAVVLVLLVAASCVIALINTVEIRDTQQSGSPTTIRIEALAKQISDCTTPGRPCYQQAQARTAGVLSELQVLAIVTATCADAPGSQTYRQISACVAASPYIPHHPR